LKQKISGDSLTSRFLEIVEILEEESRRFWIPHIDREDGYVLASLSYYIAILGGKVFIDAGAGIGYSTSWIMYGLSKASTNGKIYLYAIERDPARYRYLGENVEKLKSILLGKESDVEVNVLNRDAVDFLGEEDLEIDMVFVDIEKKRYIDILRILPTKLSRVGIAVFHNALVPGLDKEFVEFLESQDKLVHHAIPTPLGLLIVKKVT
jgi:predicted O-methyltransferase YrrM